MMAAGSTPIGATREYWEVREARRGKTEGAEGK